MRGTALVLVLAGVALAACNPGDRKQSGGGQPQTAPPSQASNPPKDYLKSEKSDASKAEDSMPAPSGGDN